MNGRTIWTVGHSNRTLEQFLAMLVESSIGAVADVRRFPGSRRQPQFERGALTQSLATAGIQYHHFPALGGRRTVRLPDTPNNGWRVESFNAYADHMQSSEFQSALTELEALASAARTAVMCAEAVPWRCHRRLIADALVANHWTVLDIYNSGRTKEHQLTEFALIVDGVVIYPGLPGLK